MSDNQRNLIEVLISSVLPLVGLAVWMIVKIFTFEKKLAVLEEKMGSGFDNIKSMLTERHR